MAKKGNILTPKQFQQQWMHALHRYQLNVWNFQAEAGRAGVEVFKGSFPMRRLNTSSSKPWKKRSKTWRKKHPILEETGTLKNSIEWKYLGGIGGKKGVRIYTNPTKFYTAKRHRGFCYAAVHNDPDGSHTYGRSGVPSVQRQFIGNSSFLDRKFRALAPMIFKGFPGL